jgi:glycosyltransferase involved in cell wall biosynthesis
LAPLKILQIIDDRCCEAIANFVVDQCEALANLGHQIILLEQSKQDIDEKAVTMKSEKELRASISHISQLPANIFRFAKYIKRIQPDIIVVHQGESHFVAAFGILKSGLKIPLVRFRWDNRPRGISILARWVTKYLTAGVGVPSERAREYVLRHFKLSRIKTFYPAIDTSYYKPREKDQAFARKLGLKPQEIIIGLVGRLEIDGGHRHFIEASKLASLRNPNIKFIVAGKDGSVKADHLKILVEKWRLSNRYIFIGHHQDIRQVMSLFDIGVVTTAGFKPISRVLLEYMAIGIPVIATGINQSPEILGNNGLLVPPGDPVAMAEAIGKLAQDQKLRQSLGHKGLTVAADCYTIAQLGKQSESFFQEIMGGTNQSLSQ